MTRQRLYPQYKKRCDEYFWNAHRVKPVGLADYF